MGGARPRAGPGARGRPQGHGLAAGQLEVQRCARLPSPTLTGRARPRARHRRGRPLPGAGRPRAAQHVPAAAGAAAPGRQFVGSRFCAWRCRRGSRDTTSAAWQKAPSARLPVVPASGHDHSWRPVQVQGASRQVGRARQTPGIPGQWGGQLHCLGRHGGQCSAAPGGCECVLMRAPARRRGPAGA